MTEAKSAAIVRAEFAKLLPEGHVGEIEDVPLAELGIDSLDFFEKLMVLEDDHGINIPVAELDSQITLRSILLTLNRNRG